MGVIAREVVCVILIWTCVLISKNTEPPINPIVSFSTSDWMQYSEPYWGQETFSNGLPAVPTFICGLGVSTLIWSLIMVDMRERVGWDAALVKRNSILFILGLLFSLGVALLITEILRWIVEEPRPDYISRCFGLDDSDEILDMAQRLATERGKSEKALACVNVSITKKEMADGLRSFPSGHTMAAVSGFMFTGMSIGKHSMATRTKRLSIFVLTILAVAISLSRILLNKHHWIDVICSCFCAFCIVIYSTVKYWLILPSDLSDERYAQDHDIRTSMEMAAPLV